MPNKNMDTQLFFNNYPLSNSSSLEVRLNRVLHTRVL